MFFFYSSTQNSISHFIVTVLGTTVKEKYLGVTISDDMKVSEKSGIAASKGNQIIGLITRNITYKEKKLIIPLYKTIVRPHFIVYIQVPMSCM